MAGPFLPSDFQNPSHTLSVRDDGVSSRNPTLFPARFLLRAPVITAVAWISTAAAINAQPNLHNNLALSSGQPVLTLLHDWPSPIPIPRSYPPDQIQNRLALNSGLPVVLNQTDWPTPSPPVPPIRVDAVQSLNAQISAPPVVRNQTDWPLPPLPAPPIRVDAILNPDPGLYTPVAVPIAPNDTPLPSPPLFRVLGVMHRPEFVIGNIPPIQTELFLMAPRLPPLVTELTRNGIVLPLPGSGVPFSQSDWPIPALRPPTPHTWLFYYIQDQTAPSFIQFDWPLPARVPSLTWDVTPNRLLYPFVAPQAPFRQSDWPNASTVKTAKDFDPYNRNVFLPPPQGQPGHQTDWPLPQGPIPSDIRAGSSKRFAGFTDVPPPSLYDWPRPVAPPYTVDLASHASKRFAALQDTRPFNVSDWPLPRVPIAMPDVRGGVPNSASLLVPAAGLLVTGIATIVQVSSGLAPIVQFTTAQTPITLINTTVVGE